MKILVDNSVVRDAIVGEFDAQPHSVVWGGREIVTDVAVMRRRPLPPPDQVTRRQAILALPTIARLAQEQKLSLFTYEELNWESVHGRDPAVGTKGDLFARVEMKHVETAVSRSYFQQSLIDQYWEKESLTKFCKFLLEVNEAAIASVSRRQNLPEMTIGSIKELSRFKLICDHAHEDHLTDLFHIWTGERNDCDYFLTMERRICNWIRARKNVEFRCAPIRPNELLAKLGISDLEPMPFEEGTVLDYSQALE